MVIEVLGTSIAFTTVMTFMMYCGVAFPAEEKFALSVVHINSKKKVIDWVTTSQIAVIISDKHK